MMAFLEWIKEQFTWLKGFFSEQTPSGQKASSRRIISLAITWAFIITYIRVSWDQRQVPDIPQTWALLFAAILGLSIYANKVNNAKGN